jgi:heterodisulfide reductase subunit A
MLPRDGRMKPRTGVYICHCGLNIANTVDVKAVTAFALRLPNVVVARDYTYMCSDPGQAFITQDIRDLGLTHVVVAACSPRMHEPTFRAAIQKAGLNPYCLEMANIREHCSWVHADRASATVKAMDLVSSAVAKVAWLVPLQERQVGVTEAALVIGGGIAGMQAALDIADAGFKVYLVEREPYLGGRAAQLNTTFPTQERVSDLLAPLMKNVFAHPGIEPITNAAVRKVDGFIGNFRVTVGERPCFVDPTKCTACGKCADVCPVSVPDRFNADLTTRRAIYQLPYPPAPPLGKSKISRRPRGTEGLEVEDLPQTPRDRGARSRAEGAKRRAGGRGGVEDEVSPFAIDERHCTYVQDHVCNPSSPPFAKGGQGGVREVVPCLAACPERAIDFSREETSVELAVGAIVVATGAATFDAANIPELGFGAYPNVITSLQFERLASPAGPTHGKIVVNGLVPKDVVFIQCVGSRDQVRGIQYCSRVCCMVAAKQAYLIKQESPQANVTVFYADVRAFGKGFEEFYDKVREAGVRYRRGYASEVYRRGDKLVVRAEDTLIQKPVEVAADLVVLSIGLKPRVESDEIARLLSLTRSGDGFLAESHPKLRPVDTIVDGVFLAGTCQGPKDIVDTIAQAKAAASSALAPLCRGHVMIESATSFVDQELCAGCGLCAAACAYGALTLNARTHKIKVNEVLCKGCGACAAACPSKAIQVMQFTPRQILSQIASLA